ncbi:class I SAM-dependent methyltransferase [Mesorhizobium japonicum]|uniref:class I SAM-dependent methyltransferase n=1 Tax=Mesorhizobium japonicum TaxID=2066070 RepID=UPI003B58FE75
MHRALQYEALSNVSFGGSILDIGGGDLAHYMSLILSQPNVTSYASINISAEMLPTYQVDLTDVSKLPLIKSDMVVSLNTLEHLRRPECVLKYAYDVLNPNGKLVIIIPFLIRVHASPHDYVRLTATWWTETLMEIGFSEIIVEPLVWDPIASGAAVCGEVGPFRLVRRMLWPLYGLLYSFIKGSNEDRYPAVIGGKVSEFALGYLVEARRPT